MLTTLPLYSETHNLRNKPVGHPVTFVLKHILSCFTDLSFKHRWTTECLAVLHNEAYGSKTPTHATVMRLDRTIRSFAMPIIYQKTPEGGQDGEEPPEYLNSITFLLQRASALAGREICETPASFEYFISSHQPSKAYMYLHRKLLLLH